jgi:hypothetical protein
MLFIKVLLLGFDLLHLILLAGEEDVVVYSSCDGERFFLIWLDLS